MNRPGEFFSWKEMQCTSTGLSNVPGDEEREHLVELCVLILDPIRRALGPVRITSGYRSWAVNTEIGGSKTSVHMLGLAADLKIKGVDSQVIAEWIVDNLDGVYDQVILYHPSRGGHVHIGLPRPGREPRCQSLYAPSGGGYIKA